jgi:monooxygenase
VVGVEHVDVLIIGAGLSGIGAAVHLEQRCRGRRYLILEGRSRLGGTWDLFRYPGVRSDSDMHTLGYEFKPWVADEAIADGPAILAYVNEAAEEHGVLRHVRFDHAVRRASWRAERSRWEVVAEHEGREVAFSCSFLLLCAGYYRYDHGHLPEIAGLEDFAGQVLEPQRWPEDFDPAGQRIVVIGSGATAVTLVPALARLGAQVTMLQRTPTWMASRPRVDRVARALRRLLPDTWAYALTRAKNTRFQQLLYRRTRRQPDQVASVLLKGIARQLPHGADLSDFHPPYGPWDQRLCLVADGDLFTAMREGRAQVVTDRIARVLPGGVELEGGSVLEADCLVLATGLEVQVLGGTAFDLDGVPIDFSTALMYRGCMYEGVPNLASVFGYVNASWTLRSDLIDRFVCRVLNRMAATGATRVVPRCSDPEVERREWITDFTPGYLTRAMDRLPRQGSRDPWRNDQDYAHDRAMLLERTLDDGELCFEAQRGVATAVVK